MSKQGACEYYTSGHAIPGTPQCGRPAVLRYPSMGGGYMHLCREHGEPHQRYCERWDGQQWVGGEQTR